MKKIYLFVDDVRDFKGILPEEMVLVTARTYAQTIGALNHFTTNGCAILIDLDHDLGEQKSGYDIAKYIVEHQMKNVSWHIHSMNPVGRQNIEQLLAHYGFQSF